jgi:hypothetical protein
MFRQQFGPTPQSRTFESVVRFEFMTTPWPSIVLSCWVSAQIRGEIRGRAHINHCRRGFVSPSQGIDDLAIAAIQSDSDMLHTYQMVFTSRAASYSMHTYAYVDAPCTCIQVVST